MEKVMKKELTEIVLVVDRSGSMDCVREDAEGGINTFIEEQKKHEGDATLTLVQFDTKYEFVCRGTPIQDVPHYTLVPRGMTALLDAVGKAINETGERLSTILEKDRPGLVVFVVMTDGLENSSKEFTKSQIKEMISRQQDQYRWQFTFLGANQNAFREGEGVGIRNDAAANFAPENSRNAMKAASANVCRMRASFSVGEEVVNSYTDEERASME
jgi:uncharacterized protein YegL